MKIITLWQPWATLLVLGIKKYETRHWETNYRGKFAIHAAKRPLNDLEFPGITQNSLTYKYEFLKSLNYPLGQIVGTCELVDCLLMTSKSTNNVKEIFFPKVSPEERSYGNWAEGRYAWEMKNPVLLENPIPYRGEQGIKPLKAEIIELINQQSENHEDK